MKMKIGDITEIIDGDRGKNYPKKSDFKYEGFCLFLNTGNVTSDGFVFKNNDFISEEKSNMLRKGKLERGDLVFTTRGTVGNVAYYSNNVPYDHVRINSGMVIFRVFENKVYNKFLYQLLKHKNSKIYIRQYCTGSAQPQLPIMNLRNIELNIPPLETQNKIARILSAYDDLIENNERQIKLLEEAAERLYKEWFVDLHFPGYEDVEIVDGLPEGWKETTIKEIGCRLESGLRPKGGIDKNLKEGVPSIGAENVIGLGKYNYSVEKIIKEDFFLKMKKGVVQDRDILIYKDGAYIGRTTLFQDGFPHKIACVNEHVFLLHTNNENLQYFLFFTLYQKEYYDKMQNLNKNSAQPGINQKNLLSLNIKLPNGKLILEFNKNIEPIMKQIFVKARQNNKLEEARDRLLPKLMSGEIEV